MVGFQWQRYSVREEMIKNNKKKFRACKYCGDFFYGAGRNPKVCPKCFEKNKKIRISNMKKSWVKRAEKKKSI